MLDEQIHVEQKGKPVDCKVWAFFLSKVKYKYIGEVKCFVIFLFSLMALILISFLTVFVLTAYRACWNTNAAKMLVQELDNRFPFYHVMNAIGIMYPQYWCQISAEEMFDKHLRAY